MGLETTDSRLLELEAGVVAFGMALITGWLVGVLLVQCKSGAVFPLGLLLAAVTLLVWWDTSVRVVVSFLLLMIGYTWLFSLQRASQQRSDWLPSHQRRSRQGGAAPSLVGTFPGTPGVIIAWRTWRDTKPGGEGAARTDGGGPATIFFPPTSGEINQQEIIASLRHMAQLQRAR